MPRARAPAGGQGAAVGGGAAAAGGRILGGCLLRRAVLRGHRAAEPGGRAAAPAAALRRDAARGRGDVRRVRHRAARARRARPPRRPRAGARCRRASVPSLARPCLRPPGPHAGSSQLSSARPRVLGGQGAHAHARRSVNSCICQAGVGLELRVACVLAGLCKFLCRFVRRACVRRGFWAALAVLRPCDIALARPHRRPCLSPVMSTDGP